jgi:hypothetical protein
MFALGRLEFSLAIIYTPRSNTMKKSKWPDFIVTVIMRFAAGVVLGAVVGLVGGYRGILRAFSRDHTRGPVIWLSLCGLVGGIIAVCRTHYWQTPWYKGRDDDQDAVAKAFLHHPPRTPPE